MPKRPTFRARDAEKTLLSMISTRAEDLHDPLPTVRALGKLVGLSYSTVSRLLQRFVQDGLAWQHPNGRFYPKYPGSQAMEGIPMVILGRQIQNWSKLYQEIFEGISAQCCALGCPLLFLSSDKLVRQQSPERPPKFATRSTQLRELQALTTTMPRLSAGVLLDHLWDEELLQTATPPQVQRIMLARRTTSGSLISSAPDFGAGARLLLDHLIQSGCGQIYLGIPFTGDQAVEAANDAVRSEACARGFPVIATLDCSTAAKRHASIARLARCDRDCAVVCSEDNVTALMWHELVEIRPRLKHIRLAAMQGTSALELPIPRLRFDYHQLGRNAVMAAIGQRRDHHLLAPKLIIP